MRRGPLIRQLLGTYLLVTCLALLAITFYTSRWVRDFVEEQMRLDLESRARLVAAQLADPLQEGRLERVQALCAELSDYAHTRFTVVLPSGKVVADSQRNPEELDNYAAHPEVSKAIAGQVGFDIRYSPILKEDVMFVAVPQPQRPSPAAVVRASIPATVLEEALSSIHHRIAWGGLLVALLAAPISLLVSHRITRPLEMIRRGAERFARGDLSKPMPIPDAREAAKLAETMNQMAAQLSERIEREVRQRSEQEAVLSSMVEGVFAVDVDERIISMNQAAARLFHANLDKIGGKDLQEVVRNPDLQRFVSSALSSETPVESEIFLAGPGGEQVLQANGTVLRDSSGREIGAVVVLNDVTHLRRLESVRRDFVANVSHELRTPITSIKGFVETLLDGALQDSQDTRHFLQIVAKQADRLNAIIEDLLTLSRVEQEAEKAEIVLAEHSVTEVVTAAVELCAPKAAKKEVRLEQHCPPDLKARINAPLLEQAVINLLDNAIKYSEVGSLVVVQAEESGEEVVVSVEDHGCGIAPEHLPRLFERFYRVDKARSRRLGGTGLGLAIVKHIAQTHNGLVTVKSEPGHGSLFSIHLPGKRVA
jgi:two-component system phosphate regulon sensor histidine kinase PhoR